MEGVQVCSSVSSHGWGGIDGAIGGGKLMGGGREFFVPTSIHHSVLVPA